MNEAILLSRIIQYIYLSVCILFMYLDQKKRYKIFFLNYSTNLKSNFLL